MRMDSCKNPRVLTAAVVFLLLAIAAAAAWIILLTLKVNTLSVELEHLKSVEVQRAHNESIVAVKVNKELQAQVPDEGNDDSISKLNASLLACQAEGIILQQNVTDLKAQVDELSHEKSRIIKELTSLQGNITALKEEVSTLQLQNFNLTETTEKLQNDTHRLEMELGILQKENIILNLTAIILQENVTKLENEVNVLSEENLILNRTAAALQENVTATEMKILDLVKENAHLRNTSSLLLVNLTAQLNETNVLQEEIAILKKENARIPYIIANFTALHHEMRNITSDLEECNQRYEETEKRRIQEMSEINQQMNKTREEQ
ncbi:golgin IMH1-like isoform X4 [Protopterus annectens]|uniref:golgin IMH1-like isoform X4 n=1 Tax=Protopterus annectens TaxID=7888 RepID=UPI001CFAC121|nr:golgin IMH1-like isoform X4 [Protopterus annectens]